MSASAERFCSPGQNRTTMRGLEKWKTADTACRLVAADMMPRGTGVILPQLRGIDPESAGYVVLKPSIGLLESVHPRLPASLFHSLIGSVNRWMRTYDYRDAEEHVELLREWASSDDNPDDYEFANVEGCTPKSLK